MKKLLMLSAAALIITASCNKQEMPAPATDQSKVSRPVINTTRVNGDTPVKYQNPGIIFRPISTY